MSCHEFEGLIALHVEGDLHEAERRRVEQHLRTCAACVTLADELRESQAAFKSMRQDVAEQSALSTVRACVLADIAGMESGSLFERLFLGGFRQRATLAGIAVVLVGGAVLWFSVDRRIPSGPAADPVAVVRMPAQEVKLSEPSTPPTAPPKPTARPPRQQKPPRPVVAPSESQPQVTIKLLTDDPNVIIYWLGDEKGD
jgi:anti-sigma factor RsiW